MLRTEPHQAASFKSEWLRTHLKCPACGASAFDAALSCSSCGWAPDIIQGTPNFITEDMALDFRVVETENVSAHAYSPSVIEILDKVVEAGGMALDCGAGSRSYISEHLVQTEIKAYPNVDVLAVNQLLPFVDDSFDAGDLLEAGRARPRYRARAARHLRQARARHRLSGGRTRPPPRIVREPPCRAR